VSGRAFDATSALVGRAWCEALRVPTAGTMTWEESGGDSLATLHLLVLLEKALGRKLSFDLVGPDMTALQLAASLASSAPRGEDAFDAVPTVFLFPGMFGDEPRLAAFRRSFAGRLRFELVEHPDVTSPRAVLMDLAATGRVAAAAIGAVQPDGPLHLAGYSYGGGVAFEAARHLQACGREIAFLGIIDTTLDAAATPLWEMPRRMALRLLGRSDAGRRWLFRLIAGLGPRWFLAARRRLLTNYRYAAIGRWRPARLQAPSLLVVSEQFGDAITDRWLRLCPGIRVLRLPADHETLFERSSLDVLTPTFEEALRPIRSMPAVASV
jgi:thioesterase domain-containing protein/acyl carrier protein